VAVTQSRPLPFVVDGGGDVAKPVGAWFVEVVTCHNLPVGKLHRAWIAEVGIDDEFAVVQAFDVGEGAVAFIIAIDGHVFHQQTRFRVEDVAR
jgi:hypothetical protein